MASSLYSTGPAATQPPELDLATLEAALAGTGFAGSFHHVRTTGSTNTLALEAAQAGAATGVWLADEQTAGRGRGGHRWHSAAGYGLYLSALVRPMLGGVDVLKISLAAGLASKRAVEHVTGIAIDIRWPNDLLALCPDGESRKFGGILTESALRGDAGLNFAVIGIGMNLNHAALPEDLRPIATSLRLASPQANPLPIARERLVPVLLHALAHELYLLEAETRGSPEADPIALRFERASTWVRGLRVHVAEDDGYTGLTEGLNEHGLLRVRTEDGTSRIVRHGGVRQV